MLKNKTILLLCHGKSLETLEERIEEFKDLEDVVWTSLSTFDVPESFILSKINKEFSVVYDSSTVKNEKQYELEIRIPRLSKYLDRETKNVYLCTNSDRNNLFLLRNRICPEFNKKYKSKIIYAEDLKINPCNFKVSLHLYIACLYKMNCKQIMLFGADGGAKYGNAIESYYKHELIKKDKEVADNLNYNMIGDTNNINSTYENMMMSTLGFMPSILNCSLDSIYTVFPKISYDEGISLLKNKKNFKDFTPNA